MAINALSVLFRGGGMSAGENARTVCQVPAALFFGSYMGRPLRVRRNCWEDWMYSILEAATVRVCRGERFEIPELINVAWLTCARYGSERRKLYLRAVSAMERYVRRELTLDGRELYFRLRNTRRYGRLYNDNDYRTSSRGHLY
jgi:hypothetical protein